MGRPFRWNERIPGRTPGCGPLGVTSFGGHTPSDSGALVRRIERRGAVAVIPPKTNREVPRVYEEHAYKERNEVERLVHLLRRYRRVATRYEKTDLNYLGFVYVAAVMGLLR